MAGFGGLGSVFQRRRKRNCGSSRRWAVKRKQPHRTSVTPTAPDPNDAKKVDILKETSVQDTKEQSSTLSIEALFFMVGSVIQKCRDTISKTCSGFLNAFLFWRGYAERVESLHQKVEELQIEIAQLHSTLKMSRDAKISGGTLQTSDGVHCFIPPPPPPVSLPPPPPPPPPPPLPPPPSIFTIPKIAIIPVKSSKPPSLKEKLDVPVAVTLQALQAVRLRKVNVTNKTELSPDKRRSPLVTLADLQKVCLRRSQSDVSLKFRSGIRRTPTKSSMNLRVQLRKVRMSRSPGGTPMQNKENEVKDSSLEMSMTKALGNKRLNDITKGLSPMKSI
ncbi:proline-rich protein 11 [Triplophysa dalaica]|uniref:proline-rich protein 11 n=1 Tax=Triplophysa dalaica TaxID=1582913 RepID=UPI0024DF38CE|nr:proline-rich protein 11 [Triplophysa dalaica]